MIDIFFHIFNIAAMVFCFYAWNRWRDPQYKWLFWSFVLINALDVWTAVRPLFHLGPTIGVFQYLIYRVILIADGVVIVAVLFVFKKKKTTFLSNPDGYSPYSFFDNKGAPIVGVLNTHFSEFPDKDKYPFFVMVYCQFKADSLGLPKNESEVKYWDKFETDFEKDMKSGCDIYFVARVTYRGSRRIAYYASDDKKVWDVVGRWEKDKDSWWNKSKEDRKFYTSVTPDEKWQHAKALRVGTVFLPPMHKKETIGLSSVPLFDWWNRRWWKWWQHKTLITKKISELHLEPSSVMAEEKMGFHGPLKPKSGFIYGIRHNSTATTNGWYLWQGEKNESPDFFEGRHAAHVISEYPYLAQYLMLPPGYGFALDTATGREDIWFDKKFIIDDANLPKIPEK